jgi:hypothetical protein
MQKVGNDGMIAVEEANTLFGGSAAEPSAFAIRPPMQALFLPMGKAGVGP